MALEDYYELTTETMSLLSTVGPNDWNLYQGFRIDSNYRLGFDPADLTVKTYWSVFGYTTQRNFAVTPQWWMPETFIPASGRHYYGYNVYASDTYSVLVNLSVPWVTYIDGYTGGTRTINSGTISPPHPEG